MSRNGTPALLRALSEEEETLGRALQLLTARGGAPSTAQDVVRHAEAIEESLDEVAWRRRRLARMTEDDAGTKVNSQGPT